MEIRYNKLCEEIINRAVIIGTQLRNEFITPEHVMMAFLENEEFCEILTECGGDIDLLKTELSLYVSKEIDSIDGDEAYTPQCSFLLEKILNMAYRNATNSDRDEITCSMVFQAMSSIEESHLSYYLAKANIDPTEVLIYMIDDMDEEDDDDDDEDAEESRMSHKDDWKKMVTCLNEHVNDHNPLIGRSDELERTMEVLCRKEKNNPLHIGEPGVGKTSIAYGLAAMIERGAVPEPLKGTKIYSLDLGNLLAGTQYRGEFEKRLKTVMKGVSREENSIIYIDEIHNLVGAGQTGEGSLDASNMLKPYFEDGSIRFIGSTTYEEFNRYFSKNKGLARRFQNIEILAPSNSETVTIIKGLQENYENFHHVKYDEGVVEYAVDMADKYINERFFPDKAIDLIDEAGAYRQLHPVAGETQPVGKDIINLILAKICRVDSFELKADESKNLASLEQRILTKIYGQNEAVEKIVTSVQLSKAGLLDDNKPISSLLFVGPTGVGKTEIARVLANELGIKLIRFDMSEYTEKHTVAKLIGSPAGYVGYEDGGLLTDEIRKTPHCVLLLDEIEKAHSDIYNILLQVMDYATLTDNKGHKADFRNVILIMTSNAGAQYAKQASVGFNSNVSLGSAMLSQVKKTFKPEFINRLSSIVTFNDMDETMASKIVKKKLGELSQKLEPKKVTLKLSDEATEYILKHGITKEYGAREIERVITSQLKTLLTKEILFGKLKEGGEANIIVENNELKLK
ncbi:AAA family ATPase [Phocaeicola paurosaccharolyticus]|uniref:AAA family ATPase n=1 Tax=Phocaeicola paurosaccharolyticus TaxID=732242 RepID=UPI00046A6E30|nr:AAA family ATPase [Phocaeicola paurosaccharolyticus]